MKTWPLLVAALVIAVPTWNQERLDPSPPVEALGSGSESLQTVLSVLRHPRCSNCHPSDDRPRQGDDQHVHLFQAERGPDNHGGRVQKCETCHHEENNQYSRVPGAPHWGLAPESMGWLGLSDEEIARALIDPARNGGRTFEDLIRHVTEDPLVLWGWQPGGSREPVSVSHEDFVSALETWLNEEGAEIPSMETNR